MICPIQARSTQPKRDSRPRLPVDHGPASGGALPAWDRSSLGRAQRCSPLALHRCVEGDRRRGANFRATDECSASGAPQSRSMPEASHSIESGPA